MAERLTIEAPLPGAPHSFTCWRWGSPQASRTVLCVHGLTRNGRDFDFLAEALAADYQVLCPDLPGRGQSPWLDNPLLYNYQTYIYDIQCLLAHFQLSRVDWVGTSMGGIIGMMMAGAAPGLIRSMVLNDVGCVIAKEGLERILSYAGARLYFDTRMQAEAQLRKICEPFGITDERHWQHFLAHSLRTREDGKTAFAYDPALVNGLPKQDVVMDIDLWALWGALQATPLMLIRGKHSDILRLDTVKDMQATHPALTYFEVENAGHAPALMADDQIVAIKKWLAAN